MHTNHMTQSRKVALPGPVRLAAADGTTVWCATPDRILTFAASGALLADVPAPGGLRSLAAGGGQVAASTERGFVEWLDPRNLDSRNFDSRKGVARTSLPAGGQPVLVPGGDEIWVLDTSSQRAWRLTREAAMVDERTLPGADRVVSDGGRLWWTSREDTMLRDGSQAVDLMTEPGDRGALIACSGSIWCSVADGLLRVNAYTAELGQTMTAPEGPVEHLACAGGILVGGTGRHGLFCLDPRIDADIRHLDVDLGGELVVLVATHAVVWAFAAGSSEATLVAVRAGENFDG